MKHTNRPFLAGLLSILLLVCGVGISQPVKTSRNPAPDCAEQCKENYDAMIQRCSKLPGPKVEKCQSAAQQQYDGCLERCKGGNTSRPSGR
jgi:hypothetical protein